MTKLSKVSKLIISFLWVISLFAYSPVLGQSLAKDATDFNDHMIVPYHYTCEYTSLSISNKEKKWNGQYIGFRLVLLGLGVGLYAGVDNTIYQFSNSQGTLTPAQNTTVLEIALAGLGFMFAGAVAINNYNENHKIAIISAGNGIGFAYNFK